MDGIHESGPAGRRANTYSESHAAWDRPSVHFLLPQRRRQPRRYLRCQRRAVESSRRSHPAISWRHRAIHDLVSETVANDRRSVPTSFCTQLGSGARARRFLYADSPSVESRICRRDAACRRRGVARERRNRTNAAFPRAKRIRNNNAGRDIPGRHVGPACGFGQRGRFIHDRAQLFRRAKPATV